MTRFYGSTVRQFWDDGWEPIVLFGCGCDWRPSRAIACRRHRDAVLFGQNDGNHPCGHDRQGTDAWLNCRTCRRLDRLVQP